MRRGPCWSPAPTGTGKTSLVEELADIFEHEGVRFGVDFLPRSGSAGSTTAPPTMRRGARSCRGTSPRSSGTRRDAGRPDRKIAGTVRSREDLDAIVTTLAMPTWTVRLHGVDRGIERGSHRRHGRTGGRLEVAREQVASGAGEDIGDLVVASDRPVRELATEVLAWSEAAPDTA